MRKKLVVMGILGIAISLVCLTQLFAGRTLSDDAIARLYGGCWYCINCVEPEIVVCLTDETACEGKQAGDVCSGPEVMLSQTIKSGYCSDPAVRGDCQEDGPHAEDEKCLRAVWRYCRCETLGEYLVCDDAEIYQLAWCIEPDIDCVFEYPAGCVVYP